MTSTEEQIKKMYQSQIDAQKEQLKQDYLKADADYQAQKDQAQKITEANLNRTAVEAQKAAVSNAELRNASGLSSGAAAQARLSESNQLQSNLTALRAQQQEVDAEAERQRSLLAQEYSSAIRKAQADNDLQLAQALYAEAQRKNDALLAEQKAAQDDQAKKQLTAAQLMAEAGDYTRLAKIYGLTSQEAATLSAALLAEQKAAQDDQAKKQLTAAQLMAEAGDYTRLAAIYGLTVDELAVLMGETSGKEPAADVPISDDRNDDGDKPSANAQKFVNRMTDADTFAKYGYVEVDGKGYTDYKAYVMAVLNRWIENGIPEKAIDTGGDKKLTNAEIAYLVQYYGLG